MAEGKVVTKRICSVETAEAVCNIQGHRPTRTLHLRQPDVAAALDALQAIDYITVHSYQFSADIAALGPYGRGYRRVRYVFDTSSGTPRILYRQDLSHLGWALGKYVRQDWVLAQNSR